MKTNILIIFFIAFTSLGFGQKLRSNGYEVSIKSFEKQEMSLFGKNQVIYSGTLKAKSKNSQKRTYIFYLTKVNGKFSHLTIRNTINEILEPRLYYNEDSNSFTYFPGTSKEESKKLISNKNVKDMVLSGGLIWLKIDK